MMIDPLIYLVSATDVDEFADFDFTEFTEDDFAKIDADVKQKTLPELTIAYENANDQNSSCQSSEGSRARENLLDTFRSGILSVTDLTSPSWCEMQFEYGLRGKRSRPLLQRPKSFKSAAGKEIKTDTVVAAKNAVITSKGQAIHKFLEREVKPDEIIVDVKSLEERWALNLANLIDSFRAMRFEGRTREVPVFGIEDGEVIIGVIDELRYQHPSGKIVQHEGAEDLSGTQYMVPSDSFVDTRTKSPHPGPFAIQIIDTKSRQRPTLPSKEDTLPSRLQIMLYYRLLSRLLSTDPPFDFAVFWQLAKVDPNRQLSRQFLEQTRLAAGEGEFQTLNLADLSALWIDLVHNLPIFTLDDELKLIYRLQKPKRGRSPSQLSKDISTQAVEEISVPEGGDEKEMLQEQDMLNNPKFQVLGTKVFKYDSDLLSSHLVDTLAWWRGERKARGVPVELTGRCLSCEYCDDCEWREEQAKVFLERAVKRRGAC